MQFGKLLQEAAGLHKVDVIGSVLVNWPLNLNLCLPQVFTQHGCLPCLWF